MPQRGHFGVPWAMLSGILRAPPFLPCGPTCPREQLISWWSRGIRGLGARYRSQADTCSVVHHRSAVGAQAQCKVPLFATPDLWDTLEDFAKLGTYASLYILTPVVGIYMYICCSYLGANTSRGLAHPSSVLPGAGSCGKKVRASWGRSESHRLFPLSEGR